MRRRLLTIAIVALAFGGVVAIPLAGDTDGDPSAAPSTSATAPPTTVAAIPSTVAPVTTFPPPTVPASVPPSPEATRALVTTTGVVVPVIGRQGDSWVVRTPCQNTATVIGGTPLGTVDVVLDAGHGGNEPGALGTGGLAEKAVNLEVVRHAEAVLRQAGISVGLTRTGDYRVSLQSRADIARSFAPRAFVSVHHNSVPDEARPTPGSETFYQVASADSKRLAGLLYEEIYRTLAGYQGITWAADLDAGAKYRRNVRGEDYYAILRLNAGITAALTELAFISNPQEEALLARPDVQRAEGEAVARGVTRYLAGEQPGGVFVEPYPRESPAGSGGGTRGCVDPPL